MALRSFETLRLVKGEDLNHHGTLFAGRASEWMIEAGFIAAAAMTDPAHIVCRKVYGLDFLRPVAKGRLLRLNARIVLAGRSRLIVRVEARRDDDTEPTIESTMAFVYVDESGAPRAHGVSVTPETEEELRLHEAATALAGG